MRTPISFLLITCCIISSNLQAQDSTEVVRVGIKITPPFITENEGKYDGLSIRSWEMVNDELDLPYEYVTFSTIEELLLAVERNQVDLSINPITVTSKRMEKIDFSQPYFISETVAAKKDNSGYLNLIMNIFSWNFLKAISALVAIIFLFGFLVWLFERKKNKDEFGGNLKGLAQGFWWSAVTMTTVGYGDKSPQTLGGRIVGFIWMFSAIIMISSLTAGIASSLTARSLQEEISSITDISGMKIATVAGSSAEELLNQYGIKTVKVDFLAEAVNMVDENRADAIVYDEPILAYELNTQGLGGDIFIANASFKKDYYSYSFPKNSRLIDKIDTELIAILKTSKWNSLIE